MPVMEITTVVGCKISCLYCPQEKLVKAYAKKSRITRMTFDTFKSCLDKIPACVDIHFSGMSEPWLNPECTNMVLYAHKKGHRILVSTALVGMGLGDIDLLRPIPFKTFAVHVPSEENREKINIDKAYLKVLNKLLKSNIKATYNYHGKNIHPAIKPLIGNNAHRLKLITRAGNIAIENIPSPERIRGPIKCARNLRQNVLLPNGDVILCCMDWGMMHVLGNLRSSDYSDLFRSKEFLEIKKGLADESADILCRYCDGCAYRVGFTSNAKRYARALLRLSKFTCDRERKIE